MGWTSYNATHYNKHGQIDRKAECDAYWLEGLNAGYFEVVKSSMVGTTYYGAIKPLKRKAPDGTVEDIPQNEQIVFCAVFLTMTNVKNYYNFYYKNMDESMFPGVCECPISVLNVLTKTDNANAIEWRNKCRESLAVKRMYRKSRVLLADLPVGSVIKFSSPKSYGNGIINQGDTVTLHKRYHSTKPFWCDGQYRWPARFIPSDFKVEKEGV